LNWQTGAGDALDLPIRLSTGDIVDAVPSGGGMINNNTKVGFDAEQRPIVGFHKYDAQGNTQLYNARLEDGAWVVHQTSAWDYRWEFGGNGTLVFAIELDGVVSQADGTLTQKWYHAEYGGWGAFRLDPEDLHAVEEIDPPLPYPRELDTPSSSFNGIHVRWAQDWNQAASSGMRYMLRWETLDSNRDMAQSPVPPPSMLTLYGFVAEQ
jgi:BNR repeat-containing family member